MIFANKDYKLNKISFSLILIALIAMAVFLYGNKNEVYGKLNELKLIPGTEYFTELYLNDYLALPQSIKKDESIHFSFTIHNLENKDTQYYYVVYFKAANGQITIFDKNTKLINKGDKEIITETYSASNQNENGAIYIELPQQNQEIHFLLNINNII